MRSSATSATQQHEQGCDLDDGLQTGFRFPIFSCTVFYAVRKIQVIFPTLLARFDGKGLIKQGPYRLLQLFLSPPPIQKKL